MKGEVLSDEMLRKAFGLFAAEETEKCDFACSQDITFSPDFEKRMERLIKKRKRPFYYFVNTAAKRAACFILALIVVLAATVVGVEGSRERKGTYSLIKFGNTVRIRFDIDGDEPSVLENYYGLSYIPEGYELSDTTRHRSGYNIQYKNKDGNEIRYSQGTMVNLSITVNIKKACAEAEETGYYVRRETESSYLWSDGKYYYHLSVYGDISKEEMLKIASSLKDENFVGPF